MSQQNFEALRALAKQRYDEACHRARKEYDDAIGHINHLVRILAVPMRQLPMYSRRSLKDTVAHVMPTDRQFTVPELMAALKSIDPDRQWRKQTITAHVRKLVNAGEARVIRRPTQNQPAIYILDSAEVQPSQFDGMTLCQSIEWALADQPLTLIEISVVLLDNGYKTAMEPKKLRDAIRKELMDRKERFTRDGEKWSLMLANC